MKFATGELYNRMFVGLIIDDEENYGFAEG